MYVCVQTDENATVLSYLCTIDSPLSSFKSPSGGRCSFHLLHIKSVRATSICLHDSTFNDDDSLPSASAPRKESRLDVCWVGFPRSLVVLGQSTVTLLRFLFPFLHIPSGSHSSASRTVVTDVRKSNSVKCVCVCVCDTGSFDG